MELCAAVKREVLPVEMGLLLHDGTWFTCPREIREATKALIKQVMETTVGLSVPLVVEFSK